MHYTIHHSFEPKTKTPPRGRFRFTKLALLSSLALRCLALRCLLRGLLCSLLYCLSFLCCHGGCELEMVADMSTRLHAKKFSCANVSTKHYRV